MRDHTDGEERSTERRGRDDSMEKNNITCLENNNNGKDAVRERDIERQKGKRCRK